MAAITDAERVLISQFRENIKDLPLSEVQEDERLLIRWIRAREHDLPKAEIMIRASMEWRKVNDIDRIHYWKPPPNLRKDYPIHVSGVDKEGFPVLCLAMGDWDIKAGIAAGERDTFLKYQDQFFDNLLSKPYANGRTQVFCIIDMDNYSFRQFTTYGAVEATIEMARRFDLNYPETLKYAYIINASRVFTMLYALVKPICAPKTISKVHIFGTNPKKWMADIHEQIPLESLPLKYGGTNAVAENILYGDGTAFTEQSE